MKYFNELHDICTKVKAGTETGISRRIVGIDFDTGSNITTTTN